jgi:RNA polymerase sigma-70 factor (ECF subfamily)
MGGGRPSRSEAAAEAPRADRAQPAPAPVDPDAFAALYRVYLAPIYRYCFRRLASVEDAEDATSLVFAKALVTFSCRRDAGAARAWLFAIAHNVVVDRYRARRPTLALAAAADVADDAPSPEAASLDADTVRSLLARLPADQARILELRLAGLTGPEIAAVLGKSPAAVKVAQFRAYARLRELLGRPGEPTEATNDPR